MAKKKDLEGWVSSKTNSEKLYDIFLKRYRRLWEDSVGMNEHDLEDMWEEILGGVGGVEHVRKFSNVADSVDYLLERVNEPGWDRVVLRDPCDAKAFIVLDRDLASRILVLGGLP